ncbi:hypothetical protein QQ008_27995 [Fulvivirgaceae bacterium BMA10]|uniref:Uncharacterized protein n=2 Tax=Splendidivirga corallicola TaxID=3051826 RepID=A0ABT8KY33_9BACT|nr:hypothetical protein [Fulvivirgaceae bacterium BMA10]
MTLQDFKNSLEDIKPPENIQDTLKALWYDGQENWEMAHDIAQEIHDSNGSWIHAYLHRKEGDRWNANYWYQRAGRSMPAISLREEWEQIVSELLGEL